MDTLERESFEEVVKRGDRYALFGLHRGYNKPGAPQQEYVGFTFWIKALPLLEEFVKSLGTGDVTDASNLGRQWVALPEQPAIQIYDLSRPVDLPGFTLNAPGQSFKMPDVRTGADTINLSFLRIKGISDMNGVKFGLKDLYPKSEAPIVKQAIGTALKRFCDEYLCPIDMTCTISSY